MIRLEQFTFRKKIKYILEFVIIVLLPMDYL